MYGATPTEWATLELIAGLGPDLLPVVSNPNATVSPGSKIKALGKTPSRYNNRREVSGFAGWTQYTASPEEIGRWAQEPDYGICIQTRHLRALDIDIDTRVAIDVVKDAERRFGASFPARCRPNSYKRLLAFYLEGDYSKRILKTETGAIEFLATGQQFIACGTHPSGARYEWTKFDGEFPTLTPEQFESLWALLEANYGTAPATSLKPAQDKVLRLTAAAENDPIAAALAEQGRVLSVEKAGRLNITCPWEENHSTESAETTTVYYPAHTGGFEHGGFKCLHAHCADMNAHDLETALGMGLDEFEVLGDEDPVRKDTPTSDRFGVVSLPQFAILQKEQWLIKGVLPRAVLGVMYGASGSGKSFMALDMCAALTLGHDWRGHRTKKIRVVYVCAEGALGFRKRLLAYCRQHDLRLEDLDIGVIEMAPNLLLKTDAIDICKSILAWGGADLVVVDTLAQVTPGGNENSGEDMGLAIRHCQGINAATKAMVLLIHHSGKDESKGARGWSGLKGALDVEMEVVRADDERCMSVTKQKDGEDGGSYGFKLLIVPVGVDEDGDEITSCVVEESSSTISQVRASAKPLGPNQLIAWSALLNALEPGVEGIPYETLLALVTEQIPPADDRREEPRGKDRRRDSARQALDSLRKRGKTIYEGGLVYPVVQE